MKIYSTQGIELLDIQVDDSSVRYRSIMSDDSLTLKFSHTTTVTVPVGSYVEFEGQRYTLWLPENFKKHNTRNFEYTITLGGWREALKLFKFKDLSAVPYRLKFSLTAKPVEFIQLLVDNMNIHSNGWTVGSCINAVERTISFNHEFCFDVLARIAQEWTTEFEFDNKTIHLRKVEKFKDAPLALSYGKGNGFKSGVGRANDGDKQPIGRLYVQGGERNIDFSTYGSSSLLLPKSQTLVYEGKTYRTDAYGMYITRDGNNLLAEDSFDANHIYPKRVGSVSAVVVVDAEKHFYDIKDASIPGSLDYAQCRIDGEKATIRFESGALSGREFDIEQTDKALTGYIHAERRFKIVPQELDGIVMPGGAFVPKVGDKYAVFNISMPDSYISDNATKTGASWEMFQECVKYFAENEKQKFNFTGELDGIWAKNQWLAIGGKIVPGGHVNFSDTQFLPDGEVVRIVSVKDYVNFPHKPEITLSNAPMVGGFGSTLGKLEAEEVVIEGNRKDGLLYSKRQWRDARETMALLEESLLKFSSGINPVTVRTMQLLVGDESLQFRFVNNKTTPTQTSHNVTFDSGNKKLTAQAGIIQHMTLGINKVSPTHKASEYKYWNMAAYVSPPLPADKAYYLYAKCSATTEAGTFVLSETPIELEGVTGFYHLLMGIINSEFDNERSFGLLYGFTEVLPGQINTPMISSPNGDLTIDLINSIVTGKLRFQKGGAVVDMEQYVDDTTTDIGNAESNAIAGSADYTDSVAGGLKTNIDGAQQSANAADAKASSAKAVTDELGTIIDGGLVSTITIYLRDLASMIETAGLSGLKGALEDNPAFWAGGTYEEALAVTSFLRKIANNVTPDVGEYDALVKIALLHSGAAKVGDFIVEESGRIAMVDPETGKSRLIFSAEKIPLLEDLLSTTNFGDSSTAIGTSLNSQPYGSTSAMLSGSTLNVDKYGSDITIVGGADFRLSGLITDDGVTIILSLNLMRNGVSFRTLESAMMGKNSHGDVRTVRGQTIRSVPPGEYTLRLTIEKQIAGESGSNSSALGLVGDIPIAWAFVRSGVRYFQFGIDGMMAFFSNNHIHFTETTGWDVRGKTNMPGVLASGSVELSGAQIGGNAWGAKVSALGASKGGTGIYNVPHTIGHTNYTAIITPHTDGCQGSISPTKGASSAQIRLTKNGSLINSGFDYTFFGRNY